MRRLLAVAVTEGHCCDGRPLLCTKDHRSRVLKILERSESVVDCGNGDDGSGCNFTCRFERREDAEAGYANRSLLAGKLDTLIQELSAEDDSLGRWLRNTILQPSDRVVDDTEARRESKDAGAEAATCEHLCAHHGAVMNSRIWSSLPKELLHVVFAGLPLYEKFRLYCVFKEWNQSLFRRVATETRDGKMFARISIKHGYPGVTMQLCDIKSNRWHKLTLTAPDEVPFQAMSSDGGLVCMLSRTLDGPARIVVCNPLTRAWRELPSHAFSRSQPGVAQLVMDHETKCYRVFVVAEEDNVEHAIIYDSATGLWSDTNLISDLIYGYWYYWTENVNEVFSDLTAAIEGPCVCDCRTGKLLSLAVGGDAISYALVKDRLFVLRTVEVECSQGRLWSRVITEYQASKEDNPSWVQLKVHQCGDFTDQFHQIESSNHEMTLLACRGLLLVATDNTLIGALRQELLWIYDLDTCKWYDIVAPPERFFVETNTTMCELQWDAVP